MIPEPNAKCLSSPSRTPIEASSYQGEARGRTPEAGRAWAPGAGQAHPAHARPLDRAAGDAAGMARTDGAKKPRRIRTPANPAVLTPTPRPTAWRMRRFAPGSTSAGWTSSNGRGYG